tara:strand:- start:9521 stop:9718 length:198 start_codon:yes stop_codon:yes gene_type:complete
MTKTTQNTKLPVAFWVAAFTHSELKDIARSRDLLIGKDKQDTAINLSEGIGNDGDDIVFNVEFEF